jgi:phospholipid/cholesterol/gamma-HCH transport system substrate-binding protein
MRRKETAIEVKVGGLVLLSIGVFVAFIMVLGDCNFSPGFQVQVDFTNAAGLKPGAPVRLAGIPAGTVKAVEFRGGLAEDEDGTTRPVFVRTTLFIEDGIRDSIRSDAVFTITTQGVLGEPYVEVTSVDQSLPPIQADEIYLGTDPPRLEQLLSAGYDIVIEAREVFARLNERGEGEGIRIGDAINNFADATEEIHDRIVENREEIDNIMANVDSVVAEIEENKETIPSILQNVESATSEFDSLGRSLNRGIGDGGDIRDIIDNVEEVTEVAAREAEPVLVSIRSAADSADRILSDNEPQIANTIDNVEAISIDLNGASADVRTIVHRVEQGEGSIGRLLRDEEIFEDMREFVRELKRRPWRIIWKE